MVALNEKPHHKGTPPRPPRLQGTGDGRATRIQELGVRILWKRWAAECEMPDAGQGLQFLDDLPIDQCSSVIERNARNRNYDPTLGRWINQDPAGYINGANTYQFVVSNPVNAVDPWELHWWDSNWWWLVPPVKIGGMVADYFINGEKTRAEAKQLPRVKQDWMDRAVYGRVNQCPGTAEPAAELRAVSDAQKTAASGGVLPGTTPGGPLPVPGVSVEINVAKGLTIGINKGVSAVAGGGAPTTNK